MKFSELKPEQIFMHRNGAPWIRRDTVNGNAVSAIDPPRATNFFFSDEVELCSPVLTPEEEFANAKTEEHDWITLEGTDFTRDPDDIPTVG